MKLTAALLPALVGISLLSSAPAAADTGDTGSGGTAESTEIQTWNSEDTGCMSVAAPATAGMALLGLAVVARRRQD